MVTAPEEKDDEEPRYTAWLDLPISTCEPMTAKDANAARRRSLHLTIAHPNSGFSVSRRPGAPRWRKGTDNAVAGEARSMKNVQPRVLIEGDENVDFLDYRHRLHRRCFG